MGIAIKAMTISRARNPTAAKTQIMGLVFCLTAGVAVGLVVGDTAAPHWLQKAPATGALQMLQ